MAEEVRGPEPGPAGAVCPLQVLLGRPGAAEVEVPELSLSDILQLGLGVEFLGPRVLPGFFLEACISPSRSSSQKCHKMDIGECRTRWEYHQSQTH